MAITTVDGLLNAMANNSTRIIIDKASISNAVAGQFYSLWRATGQPGQGAIPTTAAICINTLTGAINFTQQTPPATSYHSVFEALCSNNTTTLELHDRLMHMGGLNGTLLTSQTVNLDVHANIASNNLAARIGDSNYSDIQWWMEWYTDTGATASNATINVTYNDGTSGDLTVVAVGGTLRASRMIALNGLIPAASSGKYIRDINTVILSASTGTAGNFGFTATRYRSAIFQPIANARFMSDWANLGLPEIANESCVFPIQLASTTTTGTVRATGKISHG
jgi:hypothetical protein